MVVTVESHLQKVATINPCAQDLDPKKSDEPRNLFPRQDSNRQNLNHSICRQYD